MHVWRLLFDREPRDGYTNMAIDEAMLELHARGEIPPTVRFYCWEPPSVTIGYFQDAAATIDLEACRRAGVDLVRRITGGRAILHKRDLTYSIVAGEDHPAVCGTLMDTYRKISLALRAGLQKLGVQVELAPGNKNPGRSTAACFAVPAQYELTVAGKKLIGSAQCRRHGVFLQHGSLPLEDESELFFALLLFADPRLRKAALEHYKSRAASLSELICRRVTFEEAAAVFQAGIAGTLGVELVPGRLWAAEEALAEKLRSEKYLRPEWNLFRQGRK